MSLFLSREFRLGPGGLAPVRAPKRRMGRFQPGTKRPSRAYGSPEELGSCAIPSKAETPAETMRAPNTISPTLLFSPTPRPARTRTQAEGGDEEPRKHRGPHDGVASARRRIDAIALSIRPIAPTFP